MTTAIETAIAATAAARAIASWGDSTDLDRLATYCQRRAAADAATAAARGAAAWGGSTAPDRLASCCQRRAAADGAQVVLARRLGADGGAAAPLGERAADVDGLADRLTARLALVDAGEAPAR